MTKTCFVFALIILMMGLTSSCNTGPDIDELLIGSWRIKRANIHSIQSYRHNRSWTEQQRVEGKFSRIVENREKVEGNWAVESSKADGKTYIVITPTVIGAEKGSWVKDQPARFEVLEINKDELILNNEMGQVNTWARVRSKQSDDGEIDLGIAVINPGPIVVNLQMDRTHGKFRFLCLDMELSVEEPDGLEYISIEKNPENQIPTYHLHPIIRDLAISYFSSLTYKDTKDLVKVKAVVNGFKLILSPYFEGRLTDVKVNKVVVTANQESVTEFEQLYAEEHDGVSPSSDASKQ